MASLSTDRDKKKDPAAIPILQYGPSNNFTLFEEALVNEARKECADLGKLKEQGKYYEPEEPQSECHVLISKPMAEDNQETPIRTGCDICNDT